MTTKGQKSFSLVITPAPEIFPIRIYCSFVHDPTHSILVKPYIR